MTLTLEQLRVCIPDAGDRLAIYLEALNAAMAEFDISTPLRQAMFLAQCAHESGSLKYTHELWGPTPAQERYEGNRDLGNIYEGDGRKFCGHGLIHVTGRKNTLECLQALGRNANDIAYLETPMGAARSAAWFFKTRGCNVVADLGNFWSCSKIVNGGTNGLDDRIKHYIRCRKGLGL